MAGAGAASSVPLSDQHSASVLPAGLPVHAWSRAFQTTTVHFQILQLDRSFFLWVGTAEPVLANLAVALQSSFDPMGSVTLLTGQSECAQNLARKLAQHTKQVVYLSYNLDEGSQLLQSLVEKEILTAWAALRETQTQLKAASSDHKDQKEENSRPSDAESMSSSPSQAASAGESKETRDMAHSQQTAAQSAKKKKRSKKKGK